MKNLFKALAYLSVINSLMDLIVQAEADFGTGEGPKKKDAVLAKWKSLVGSLSGTGILKPKAAKVLTVAGPALVDVVVAVLNAEGDLAEMAASK